MCFCVCIDWDCSTTKCYMWCICGFFSYCTEKGSRCVLFGAVVVCNQSSYIFLLCVWCGCVYIYMYIIMFVKCIASKSLRYIVSFVRWCVCVWISTGWRGHVEWLCGWTVVLEILTLFQLHTHFTYQVAQSLYRDLCRATSRRSRARSCPESDCSVYHGPPRNRSPLGVSRRFSTGAKNA